MKQIIVSAVFACFVTSVFAQNENDEQKGFKKENLFTGGTVTASFYSGGTVLGANPMFGYKLANWVDAGISLNYVYSSSLDYNGYTINQHVLGPGAFTRIYPLRFLYLEGQYEHNFITQKFNDPPGSYKVEANSLLVGAGIAEGRRPGSNTFFYISILVDVLKDPNSPYLIDNYDNSGQVISTSMVPIIRAGVNIGLFQGKNKHSENNNNNNYDRSNGHRQPKYYND
jgi:hypothetical protein